MRDSRDDKDEDIDEDEVRLGRGPPPVAWAVLPLTSGRPGISHNLYNYTLGLDNGIELKLISTTTTTTTTITTTTLYIQYKLLKKG